MNNLNEKQMEAAKHGKTREAAIQQAQAELFDGYMDLWKTAARRASGLETEPVAAPAKGDKRFNDPDWTANPVFDVMKQSYLLTSNWLNKLVGAVDGVDPMTKRRVEFFTKMLTDAFSPTNFLVSNPAALREMIDSMAHGGKIAMLGIPAESVPFDWNKVVFNMLTIKGIYGREMYETWYKMTVLLQSGLDISPIITHRFHYTEYEKAFQVMISGCSGKVVLDWQ